MNGLSILALLLGGYVAGILFLIWVTPRDSKGAIPRARRAVEAPLRPEAPQRLRPGGPSPVDADGGDCAASAGLQGGGRLLLPSGAGRLRGIDG